MDSIHSLVPSPESTGQNEDMQNDFEVSIVALNASCKSKSFRILIKIMLMVSHGMFNVRIKFFN